MGENILNVPEKMEVAVGDALEARNVALPSYIGLGPPDLVVLLKHYIPPKLLPIKPNDYSFYHWTLGVDVSSSAAIAAYFGGLLEHQEKATFGRGLYKIVKCNYSSYNAFRKMDLRVDITLSEGAATPFVTDAYGMDAGGNKVELDDNFWEETYVCSILRAMSGPPKMLRPIRIKEVLSDTLSETRFLTSCADLFWNGRKMGTSESGHTLVNVDSSNNLLTTSLYKYFAKANRYERIISFFEPFICEDPVCAVMVAHADAMLDKPVRAISTIQESLSKSPESASLMLALGEVMLRSLPTDSHDKAERLVEVIRTTLKSIARQSSLPRGWFTLAQALIEMGRYEWALVIMNYAPSLPPSDYSGVDVVGFPTFSKQTAVTVAHPHISLVLQDIEQNFLSMPSEDALRLLSAPSLSKEGQAAYNLLAEMVARNGWEALTVLRTRVLERPAQLLRRSKQIMLESIDASGSYYTRGDKVLEMPPQLALEEYSEFVTASQEMQEPVKKDFGDEPAQAESADKHDSKGYEFRVPSAQARKRLDILPTATFVSVNPADDSVSAFNADDDEYRPKEICTASESVTPQESSEHAQQSSEVPTSAPAVAEPTPTEEPSSKKETGNGVEASETNDESTSAPEIEDVTIHGESDVDDALTKFLIRVTALRCSIPEEDVQTTPMDVDKASSPMIPILGISRTMDLAFHALFQDIKAFHAWKEEEKKKGFQNENLTTKINPQRTTADWLHLAMLCERLSFRSDAEVLYKMIAPQHIKAQTAVLRHDAEAGDIRNTLLGASALLSYFEERYHTKQVHPEVISSILKVISIHGMQKVRAVQIPNLHPEIANILLDAARWGSKGSDI